MTSNHGATILPFERSGRATREARSNSGIVQEAVSAAVRLEAGAAGLLNQVAANKAIIARVQVAASNPTGRAESLRATADKFLAAVRGELETER